MVQVTLNFRLQLFKKKNVICLSLGFFKLLNKREERSNNVGKTVVIFPHISGETLGALVRLVGITKA